VTREAYLYGKIPRFRAYNPLIQCFDLAREQIRDIVDMPDRRMDLLLRYLYQNRGVLAKRKRGDFAELTDSELVDIQSVFQESFQEMQD
jgi:hypothetical protein